MSTSLKEQVIAAEIVEVIDYEAAWQIAVLSREEISDVAQLVMALTFTAFRNGHACLDLTRIDSWKPLEEEISLWPREESDWLAAVAAYPHIFGAPTDVNTLPRPPFVLENKQVYISRVYQEELTVAQRLLHKNGQTVTVILGGPGTGKTYSVAQKLRHIPDNEITSLALCAPTGKASRHLRTVLDRQLREHKASDALLTALSNAPSTTIHKLLGYSPHRTPKFAYGKHTPGFGGEANPLPYELVIVDEASMMSLSLMNNLMEALSDTAEIWLVGDPHQLASVEAGSVLADIAVGAKRKDSPLNSRYDEKGPEDQRRFDKNSPIAKLAEAVKEGKYSEVEKILSEKSEDFEWIDSVAQPERMAELRKVVNAHAQSVREAALKGDAATALSLNSSLQVLCAQRQGKLGIHEWNAEVEKSIGQETSQRWYAGRPVMVTRNDASINLANGDVGVVCLENDVLVARFGDPDASTPVSLARLSDVETVHALTIHKSQGSEYDHVIVVLPEKGSRILSRELLYTGITRPKKKLTVVATKQVMKTAVSTPVRRATGLADRL